MSYIKDVLEHHLTSSMGSHYQVTIVKTQCSKDKGIPKSQSAPDPPVENDQAPLEPSLPEDECPLTVTMCFLRDF